jgi:hypothetical protein
MSQSVTQRVFELSLERLNTEFVPTAAIEARMPITRMMTTISMSENARRRR